MKISFNFNNYKLFFCSQFLNKITYIKYVNNYFIAFRFSQMIPVPTNFVNFYRVPDFDNRNSLSIYTVLGLYLCFLILYENKTI